MQKKSFFIAGLVIFYLIQILSPSKIVYFSSYFVASFFFYLSNKNIRISLLYSLILSLFSEMGLAGSWFIMEPKELNLGSGWWITPMTVLIICLLPFSLTKKNENINKADIFVFLFFLWLITNIIIFPYLNVLYGIVSLGEIVLSYFLFRIHIGKKEISYIVVILISVIFFQSFLGIGQVIRQRPLSLLSESSLLENPYGLTTVEEENLYRITGTYNHPNLLASFFLAILPFFFSFESKINTNILIVIPLLALFFTYSRVAWFFSIFYILFLIKKNFLRSVKNYYFQVVAIVIFLISVIYLLLPYISSRTATFPQAFEEFGSMGVRVKLISEGLNLLKQYPLTGVGLNRSLEVYSVNPSTNIFEKIIPSGFYRIHNTPLEITSEIGIPGLILFSLFLFFIIYEYQKYNKESYHKQALIGLFGLIFISFFNPLFHSSLFRLVFLLSSIILIR